MNKEELTETLRALKDRIIDVDNDLDIYNSEDDFDDWIESIDRWCQWFHRDALEYFRTKQGDKK